MSVHHDLSLARELTHASKKFTGATERKTRREAITNSPIRSAMPAFEQFDRGSNRFVCFFVKARRHIIAAIHHALANSGTKSSLSDYFENFFCVADRFHGQGAGGSALN